MHAVVVPENSTTVRTSPPAKPPAGPAALRWTFQALAAVSPALAEERAVDLMFRPRRHGVRVPQVPGFEARPFSVWSEGERLSAWTFGEGPAVLLVHGWEGDAAQLRAFVAPLVTAGRRVVLFDQPAHGGSTGTSADVLRFARAVRAVADVVGPLEGLVAHSLGGTGCAIAIARGMPVGRAAFLASPVEPHDFAQQVGEALGVGRLAPGILRRSCARLGFTPDELQVDREVREVTVPLLVVHDPADHEVPIRHAERLRAAWPGVEVWRVDGVGHRRILKDPAVVGRVVAHVTGGVERAGQLMP